MCVLPTTTAFEQDVCNEAVKRIMSQIKLYVIYLAVTAGDEYLFEQNNQTIRCVTFMHTGNVIVYLLKLVPLRSYRLSLGLLSSPFSHFQAEEGIRSNADQINYSMKRLRLFAHAYVTFHTIML